MKFARKLLLPGALLCAMAWQAPDACAATFRGERNDFRDETIYFAMTTRFYDGDKSNNTYCWDGKNNFNDPEWRGDFKGLISKLDYIKALGFTAVWITPVVENASGLDYHGYHAFNFNKVDPRYESDDCKFQDLIDAAHARGMKIILDIVLQHTGNFGEATLCPMFVKDYSQNLSNLDKSLKLHPNTVLPANYFDLAKPYDARIAAMKNEDGVNHDRRNSYHHVANEWNWDDPSRWWGQIAGDCVDLNTENPRVSNYLVKCYGKFIAMGVDGFRIDTAGHISRLTFNYAFIPQFEALAERYSDKRGGGPFFMFGEVCARDRNVTYRNHENCSPYFYTWKESKEYEWDYSETSWDEVEVPKGQRGSHVNAASVTQQGNDYLDDNGMPTSRNALLDGNKYHAPDHTRYSGLSVIDFPMHWNFRSTNEAWGVRYGDNLYNDATYNVTYVDSHDYAPDGAPESQRFAGSQQTWASNLNLMFTFRGIPCIYYGSEIEFKKGCPIDKGAELALKDSGRAYFGGYIEGSVKVNDFADYASATGNMAASLKHPLSLHIQRLNQLRAAIPALRKGQYSTDGCSGAISFKRRFTDATTDSYVLVALGGNATFTGIENGTYVEAITGERRSVTDGKLSSTCSGAGNMRLWVLDTKLTPAPGKVGVDGKYLYASSPVNVTQPSYDGNQEPLDTETVKDTQQGGGGDITEPENPVEPILYKGEQAVFFENDAKWQGTIKAWVWSATENFTGGSWPGQNCTYLGNGIWKWSYDGTATIANGSGVIFNNGSAQTGNMVWKNGGYYRSGSKNPEKVIPQSNVERPDEPDVPVVDPEQPDVEARSFTFYFDNSAAQWPVVNCYAWDNFNSSPLLGAWPGAPLSAKTVVDGRELYVVTLNNVKVQTPMVIFSNGGEDQTPDMPLTDRNVYTANGVEIPDTPDNPVVPGDPDDPDNPEDGIVDVITDAALSVWSADGILYVDSPRAVSLTISRIDGVNITRSIGAGVTAIANLPRGFYIVAGRKIFL